MKPTDYICTEYFFLLDIPCDMLFDFWCIIDFSFYFFFFFKKGFLNKHRLFWFKDVEALCQIF